MLMDREQTASLLPIGIVRIEGEFEKGDLLKIMGPDGKALGLGQAKYSSGEAEKALGKKGEKALIHYDYLFLFS